MRYPLFVVALLVVGCTEEPRSRLPPPNPDTPMTPDDPGGVADLAGAVPPPIPMDPGPVIISITPKLASSAGGTKITITGSGFEKTSQLFVNNALLFVDPDLVKPTEIVATLPAFPGGFGLIPVAVLNKKGQAGKNDPIKSPLSLFSGKLEFSSGSTIDSPTTSYGFVTLADLDGDGKLDMVVADGRTDISHNSTMTIYMNEGGGTFGSPYYKDVGTQLTNRIVAADVNKDGHPDLVFNTNDSGHWFAVILNKKAGARWGSFTGTPIRSDYVQNHGNGCSSVTAVDVGDFDNDGNPDVALACHYSASVQVWLGNGKGSFTYADYKYFNSQPHYYYDLKVGDFDNDGSLDLATLSAYYNVMQVVTGNGDGSLGSYDTYSLFQEPWSLEVADLDGDKQKDIVVSHRYDNRLSVFLNSNGSFNDRTDYNVGHRQGQVGVYDMDGDGILDIIVGGQEQYETRASVLLGKGKGEFGGAATFRNSGSSPWGMAVGPLDDDLRPDIVMFQRSPATAVILFNKSL